MSDEYQIIDEAPHDYYTQTPNILEYFGLSPYTFRLYAHLRRVAGESGKCWRSTATLADECRMSAGQVSKSKHELESTSPPLVRIESIPSDKGAYHQIAITDIWSINHRWFTGDDVTIKDVDGRAFHSMNDYKRSHSEQERSHSETKNIPIKKTPEPALSEKQYKQANDKVDAIIANSEKAKSSYLGREKLAPVLRDLLDVFVSDTHIKPTSRDFAGWLAEAQDWHDLGARPEHIRAAIAYARANYPAVLSPHSITKAVQGVLAGMVGRTKTPSGLTITNGIEAIE